MSEAEKRAAEADRQKIENESLKFELDKEKLKLALQIVQDLNSTFPKMNV
jgi:hypothetical protein